MGSNDKNRYNVEAIYNLIQDNGFEIIDAIEATLDIAVDYELLVAGTKEEKAHIKKLIKKLKEAKDLIKHSEV
jgi:hypothetical protein